MKRNVVSATHAKGLAVLLALGMITSSMASAPADAKAKKPKLSTTKVTVTVGKTKKVKVKNAKKVTWKISKKAKKIVKLSKKSKKGATIKGLKKGSAKISVTMKSGKKSYKKTIKVTVKAKKTSTENNTNTTNNTTNNNTNTTKTTPTPPSGNKQDGTSEPTPTATATASATATATATTGSTATASPTITATATPAPASGSAAVVIAATGSAVTSNFKEGDSIELEATISVSGCAAVGDFEWASSDESVATVSASGSSAIVTAVEAGTVEITATIVTNTGIIAIGRYNLTVQVGPLALTGDALGESAAYTYVPNGAAQYQSIGIFEIDKSKLTASTPITLSWTIVNSKGTDVKSSQGLNIGLKTGNAWNSPAVLDVYGRTGGTTEISLSSDQLSKIGADDTVYMHVSLSTAGFDGTATITGVKVGTDSLVEKCPDAYTYEEKGLNQYAPTARVDLPDNFNYKKYKTCKIEFTSSDAAMEFHGIVGHLVSDAKVEDAQYGAQETGVLTVTLNKVLTDEGTAPYIVINAGKAGFAGSVTITKVTFMP